VDASLGGHFGDKREIVDFTVTLMLNFLRADGIPKMKFGRQPSQNTVWSAGIAESR
jgi:hypothetical protein